jgi:hypothetical protein
LAFEPGCSPPSNVAATMCLGMISVVPMTTQERSPEL